MKFGSVEINLIDTQALTTFFWFLFGSFKNPLYVWGMVNGNAIKFPFIKL